LPPLAVVIAASDPSASPLSAVEPGHAVMVPVPSCARPRASGVCRPGWEKPSPG